MSFCSIRRTKSEMIQDLPEDHRTATMIGHSTLEYTNLHGDRIIRFHRTNVVTIHPDGSCTLDSGGFQTSTTKKRINDHAPCGIYQSKHVWYVSTPAGSFEFFDGFTVDRHGMPTPQTLVTLAKNGDLTMDQIADLPEGLQVAYDRALEDHPTCTYCGAEVAKCRCLGWPGGL